jgi:chromosomal replication initiator protein
MTYHGNISAVDIALNVVCDHYHLTLGEVLGRSKRQDIAQPRQVAMTICRDISKMSLSAVGRHMGGRDHTTVLHAIRAVRQRCADDPFEQAKYDVLRVRAQEILTPRFRHVRKWVFKSVRSGAVT